ncbi:MAG: helix-turn-helix domain-containing protein [Candidatus Tyrphobacter sp.]
MGKAIKAARQQARLTQEDAAHESDLSLRHYQQLEHGRDANATLRSLHAISRALGTTVGQIVVEAEGRKR